MDGQMSPAKLARTQSSLLRSSPTIRSSIHSLSSVAEEDVIAAQNDDVEAQKKRNHNAHFKPRTRPGSTGPTRFTRLNVLLASLLSLLTLLFLLRVSPDFSPSENLLLVLIFVAVALFLANRNKTLIHRSLSAVRQSLISRRGGSGGKVQWFIGESKPAWGSRRIVREGVELYSNGDFYEGEFHKGRCNGSGVYNFFVSGRYEGDWIDGRYDGYGIESWARGSRYKGQYRQGLRHGLGVYRFFTGDSYAGEWCNGQSHGVGVQSCADGSCYVGEFKCGVKHGLGCYHFRNGDSYAGEYFGDKIHGFGVYHFGNGHCYEGSWHEGRKQGYGMYTFRSGDAKCGEWDGGSLKHPLPPHNDSVLRAVQAARKTAESAINLRRVDEQVNKAVVAANRAATAARVAAVKAVQNRMDGKSCDTSV